MGGLVAEDAMKDVHEDVQKHERHPWIILSQLWKSRTVQDIALALEHEMAPAPRATPPSAAASSGTAAKRLHQIEPRKYSAVEARIFLPMAVGCSMSCHSNKAWEVKYKHKLGPPPRSRTITWSTAGLPCHVAWRMF